MRIHLLVFAFLLLSSAIYAQEVTVKDGKKFIAHHVVKGNTLFSIAREYQVNMSDILNNNDNVESGIQIGQIIYIPIFEEEIRVETVKPIVEKPKVDLISSKVNLNDTSAVHLQRFHTVEKQETLYGISKKYNVTIYDLVRINPGIESGIQLGQQILIPDENNQSSDSKSLDIIYYDTVIAHKVTKTETLYSISKRYMVAQGEIRAYNGMKNTTLQPSSTLYIPLKKDAYKPLEIREVPADKVTQETPKNEFLFEKKENYQVVVALPLGLSNPKEVFKTISTEFYMGVEYALDSLKKIGLNADVHVIDCSVDSTSYLRELSKYKKADLIIGPFSGDLVDKTSQFSATNQIRMVNPLIGYGKPIQSNPYLINATTSDVTLVQGMASYLTKENGERRIILVKTNEKDKALYNAFREVLYNGNSVTKVKFIEATVSEIPTFFAKGVDYSIVYLSRNQNEVRNFMNVIQRNSDKVGKGDIVVYGTKEWTNMDDVKDYYKNTYHFRFGMANDFDYTYPKTITILKGIRAKYNTDLTKFMAQGFDVTYYFLSKYLLNQTPESLIMNDFKFQQMNSEGGKVNTTTYIYEQKDFEYLLLKKMQ